MLVLFLAFMRRSWSNEVESSFRYDQFPTALRLRKMRITGITVWTEHMKGWLEVLRLGTIINVAPLDLVLGKRIFKCIAGETVQVYRCSLMKRTEAVPRMFRSIVPRSPPRFPPPRCLTSREQREPKFGLKLETSSSLAVRNINCPMTMDMNPPTGLNDGLFPQVGLVHAVEERI